MKTSGSLLLLLALCACKPPLEILGVVRGAKSERLLPGVHVELLEKHPEHGLAVLRAYATDTSGLFGFSGTAGYIRAARMERGTHRYFLRVAYGSAADTIPISGFRGLYDLRIAEHPSSDPVAPNDSAFKVADMHYHVSMRIHNHFGPEVHAGSQNGEADAVPIDLSWYRDQHKLRVYRSGKWRKVPRLKWARVETALRRDGSRAMDYRALVTKGMVRSKKGNNSFNHHNQATHPHIRNGHVRLAYNAISPFENILNTGFPTRFLGGVIKSGVRFPWSARLGGHRIEPCSITHWEDFLYEHSMMSAQDPEIEGANWRFLRNGDELRRDTTSFFIVTAVEGGHFLQDEMFPNTGAKDIAGRTAKEQEELIREWRRDDVLDRLDKWQRADLDSVIRKQLRRDELDRQARHDKECEPDLLIAEKDLFNAVDSALIRELRRNIDTLRSERFDPPVHMVAISHLAYNGMTGHAAALDDGGGVVNYFARKVYDLRLSNDPSYLRQWARLYFSIPGVNQYGKTMINGLASTVGGRRILIDLKHSDLITRHYFYDSIMPSGLPPICSHCGVTGMSERYWSPFNNEYSVLRDPMVRTYYPFGINLFDEEIVTIHRNKGIIGLPLEERILGGYIKRRMTWNMHIDGANEYRPEKSGKKTKRWVHSERLLRWLNACQGTQGNIPTAELVDAKTWLDSALRYTARGYPELEGDERLDIVTKDFISAAPFLQNLFYILDRILDDIERSHPATTPQEACEQAWARVCLGSDLDGLIDPIDLVPTAGEYSLFRDRLTHFIPLFLHLRKWESPQLIDKAAEKGARALLSYTSDRYTLEHAMNGLFHGNLERFTAINTKVRP